MEVRKKLGLPPLSNKIDLSGGFDFTPLNKLGIDLNDKKKCVFKIKKRGNLLKIIKKLKEIDEKIDKNQEKIEERLELIEKRITKKLDEDRENVLEHICTVQDLILDMNEEESESESESESEIENEN